MNIIKPILIGTLAASIVASTGCAGNAPGNRYAANRAGDGMNTGRYIVDGAGHPGRSGGFYGSYSAGGAVREGHVQEGGRSIVRRDGFDGHMNRGFIHRDGRRPARDGLDGFTNRGGRFDGSSTARDGYNGNMNRFHDGRNTTLDGRDGNVNRNHSGKNTTVRNNNMNPGNGTANRSSHLGRDGMTATQRPSL